MSTKLNLASRRFSNRSLPWIVSALLIFISMVSLIYIVRGTRQAQAQARIVQHDINALSQQERTLRQEAEAVRSSLSTEQLQTLDAAHSLVDRKQFSWSKLFSDLENALPGDVRVKRIVVRGVGRQADQRLADLELAVVAKTPSAVTDMISQMDRGGVFHAELRSQNLQRGRGESGAEYELAVIYRPRAGMPIDSSTPAPGNAVGMVSSGGRR